MPQYGTYGNTIYDLYHGGNAPRPNAIYDVYHGGNMPRPNAIYDVYHGGNMPRPNAIYDIYHGGTGDVENPSNPSYSPLPTYSGYSAPITQAFGYNQPSPAKPAAPTQAPTTTAPQAPTQQPSPLQNIPASTLQPAAPTALSQPTPTASTAATRTQAGGIPQNVTPLPTYPQFNQGFQGFASPAGGTMPGTNQANPYFQYF